MLSPAQPSLPRFAILPPPPPPPDTSSAASDERALLRGLLADEEGAWREFDTRYSRLILRCITRVTGRFTARLSPDDVREIQAMLWVQLLANDKRKLRTFEPDRGNKLGSWVGMLAIHTAYDFLRRIRREPRATALAEAESLTSDLPDPFETLASRQQAALLGDVLSELSAKDREFVMLYYGEGLDPVVVAERMAISVKTVYSKKHKVRARLESLLAERRLAA